MFGVVRPCRHGMCTTLFKDWMAHLCGLCLTLRDEHGHRARLVTNYDGLLVSVLTEAQSAALSPRRGAGACALRGFKKAEVVSAQAEGARLAAAVSLLLAAGKTRDHIADGDGPYARRPVAATAGLIAARWDAAGGRTGADLGFDVDVLREAVARQSVLESTPGRTLLELLEPTETAVAAAFAHTAVLAGRPGNAEPLAEAGRFFGRLAHLLDAVEDLPADHAEGAFNPLLATDTPLAEARRLCQESLHGLRLALADVEFENRALVDALLEREVRKSVDRTFQGHPYAVLDEPAGPSVKGGLPLLPVVGQYPPPPPGHYPPPGAFPPGAKPPRKRPGFGPELCLAGTLVGCTCGLWRPEWSNYYNERWDERCGCTRCDRNNNCDCSGCDCSGCGDCCSCDGCCCDGCCCDGCST